MTFYSSSFMIFFICLLIALRFTRTLKSQKIIFLIANFAFYAFWDAKLFLIVLFEVIVVYLSGKKMINNKKKRHVVIPTIILLITLGYFKYANFFIDSFSRMFGLDVNITLQIILPLGISFYTFQALSYIFDIYYGKIQPEDDFLKVAVYISFFPQIISGPIVKAKMFLPQLEYMHQVNLKQLSEGIQVFLVGLAKKIVIADRIGVCVDAVYMAPKAYNGVSVIVAVIGYAIQIYCDFSGYSDMAIGIAKVMGFDLGKNFNVPYLAKNPSDFWRRWHISLSTWFRDYLYIPLGGNRKGKIRTYFNLLITMVVSGLWHGASWNFVIWGFAHGIASALHKAFSDFVKQRNLNIDNRNWKKVVNILSLIFNNVFVILLWIIFRADNMDHAFSIFNSMFNTSGITYISPYVVVYILIILLYHMWVRYKNDGEEEYVILDLNKFRNKVVICFVLLLILALMYVGQSAFIYAQF